MTVTLGTFHTLVSDALGRGTALDASIPLRTSMAARWLERNYLFQYMRTWKVLEVLVAADNPEIISLFGLELRNVELLRRRNTADDGSYNFNRPIKKRDPADRESQPLGEPTSFWLNGVSSIILDTVPDENMTFEAHLQQFTTWGSGTSWTHWLLDNATNLLLCRTLMMMCPRSRDPSMYDMYKSEFDLEIQSFTVSEEELKTGEVISLWEPPEGYDHTSLRNGVSEA